MSFLNHLTACVLLLCLVPISLAQEIVDQWKYTFHDPGEGWTMEGFDTQGWKSGVGGFGTRGTPAARIGTTWSTQNIWLRKYFQLAKQLSKPALLIHHDEDCEVYLNGRQVLSLKGFSTEYAVLPLDSQAKGAIQAGQNVLAVHCRQTGGGQFIDVHVIDADDVPTLPQPARNTTPYQSTLITQWGSELDPANAWREYPRPQMVRPNWKCLNGQWDYAVTSDSQPEFPETWQGKILVPFCLESKLGGVQRLLDVHEALWYRRKFEVGDIDHRLLLHFEAVDYRCEVFVNGKSVGKHTGGHTPFWFDITSAARTGSNDLVVRVEDKTEGFQLRGKQVLNAQGIWYTQVSGIWQTVWLEQVPHNFIDKVKLATDAHQGQIAVNVRVNAIDNGPAKFEVLVMDQGEPVVSGISELDGEHLTLNIPNNKLKLWSPNSPFLYDLRIRLLDKEGTTLDQVESYAGIRTVSKVRDSQGHLRFALNGQPIFHWGPLDQGWWPDGLLTPPSDQAMTFDIQWLKSAGFNMIRKHIKVEPRRYYYHCDRIGMLMWQDQVSGGKDPPWTRLEPNPKDALWPDAEHQQFMVELESMIDSLENHPCIVCWVPFNEAWGQHRTMQVGQWTVQRDPSRHVNIASGGNFWPVGDVVDEHSYPDPVFPFHLDQGRFGDFIKVMGEFGGHGLPVPGHMWDNDRENWGYGGLPKNQQEFEQRYRKSLDKLIELKKQGIAAGVYTQTTDVEIEINGLMTYDRKVIKFPAEELKKIHARLLDQ